MDYLNKIPIDISAPLPVVFSVVKKKELKNFHSSVNEVKILCQKVHVEGLTSNLIVLSENKETTDYLIDKSV